MNRFVALCTLGFASLDQASAFQKVRGQDPGVSLQLTEGFFREWRTVMMKQSVDYLNEHKGLLP